MDDTGNNTATGSPKGKAKQTISFKKGRRGPYSSRNGNLSGKDMNQDPDQNKSLSESSHEQSWDGDKTMCGKLKFIIIAHQL